MKEQTVIGLEEVGGEVFARAISMVEKLSGGEFLNILSINASSVSFNNALMNKGHDITPVSVSTAKALTKSKNEAFDIVLVDDFFNLFKSNEISVDEIRPLLEAGGVILATQVNEAFVESKSHQTENIIYDLFGVCEFAVLAFDMVDIADYLVLAGLSGSREGCVGRYMDSKEQTNILVLANDVNVTHADVRLIQPIKGWASRCASNLKSVSYIDCQEAHIDWADIVILQRHLDHIVVDLLKKVVEKRKKIIYETDDYLLELPEHLSHHELGLLAHKSYLDVVLPQVDCITVTTKRLATQFEQFSRPIAIIPNISVDAGFQPIDPGEWENGVATIVVAASDAMVVDYIIPSVKDILSRKDLNVKVLVIGPPADVFVREGVEIQKIPNMPYMEFKKFIRRLDNPIGVIPLDDSVFSSCKSAIKYFDYSLAGMPVICSNLPPYSDIITNNIDGLLIENTQEAWTTSIIDLIVSVNKRKKLNAGAQTLVKENFSQNNAIVHWDMLFNRLINNGFSTNPPAHKVEVLQSPVKRNIPYYLKHIINFESYKAVFRVVRRDGIGTLIKKHLM